MCSETIRVMRKPSCRGENPRSRAILTWVEISRSALEHNLGVIRRQIGPDVHLMAVVKANAYGHGATLIARLLLEAGADALGVVSLTEARELRNVGIRAPIHVLGYIPPEKADEVVRYRLRPVVFSTEFIKALEQAGATCDQVTDVSIKVETGLNRHGLAGKNLDCAMEMIARCRYVNATGLCTHFARSDEADAGPTRLQLARLQSAMDRFRSRGHRLELSHAANSAATLLYSETHLQMVRCGLALYGLYPSRVVQQALGETTLRQALSFKTRVVQVRNVRKGEAVSYGGTWTAPARTRLAVLPVGYADGYRRHLSNCGHVLIQGQRAKTLGRVCMNLCMVDISGIGGVKRGDEVTLIDPDPESGITIDQLAKVLQTINYEVPCSVPGSIERILVP